VSLKRKTGDVIACQTITYKAWELAESHNIRWRYFMQSNGFSLRRRTSLCLKLPADVEEKLVASQ
jgi:hypothetical protein